MFEGREPIYVQIAQQIRAEILAGTLPEEGQVMSTTQYATTYRINPATAAKAFAELVDEGLLYKRRGVGMFVAAGARERLLDQHRQTFFTDVLDPVLKQADLLGIGVEELVEHITRTHPRRTAR
ncbi:GntR family transcriptional regulator [Georgenia thermotolerans]|uniref:GntR family transcriptional regulator n=1 Tax=Georgenia thermotolerans TaxID=527326 RepID=A0A7J5UKH4_9MICO|nr:GntR family transcriptional regulator [Georgenia thermotolerans]KAE8762780.1 GntR family transcriptional regulator [Georgenia thermotolerans]